MTSSTLELSRKERKTVSLLSLNLTRHIKVNLKKDSIMALDS